jgi:hypothetical protein
MAAMLWFVVETTDQGDAQAAFLTALGSSLTRLGVGDLALTDWMSEFQVPGERLGYMLAGFLSFGPLVIVDLDPVPIFDGPDDSPQLLAWGINLQVTCSTEEDGQDQIAADAIAAWWRTIPAVSRGLSHFNHARYPDAVAPTAHDQRVPGVGSTLSLDDSGDVLALDDAGDLGLATVSDVNILVRLLSVPPLHPRQVFA